MVVARVGKREHDAAELFGILGQLPLGGQAHVNDAQNVLFKHFGRVAQFVVGVDLHRDLAVGPLGDTIGEHLCRLVAGVLRIGVVSQLQYHLCFGHRPQTENGRPYESVKKYSSHSQSPFSM